MKSFKEIKSSPALKNILTMLSSSSVSQVIPLITAPILTRIYSPLDFGLFEVYYSLMTILAMLPNISLEKAVLIEKDNRNAFNLLVTCILTNLLFILLISLIIAGTADFVIDFYNIESPKTEWLYYIPIGMAFSSLYNLLTQWIIRHGLFKYLAVNRIIFSISNAGIQIGLGLMYLGFTGLIVGNVISYAIVFILMTITAIKRTELLTHRIVLKGVKTSVSNYKDFIAFTLPSDIVNNVARQLPTIMIGRYFSPIILGYYGMARRIIGLPLGFISNSIQDVFRKESTDEFNKTGGVVKTFKTTFALLTAFGVVFILGLYTVGDNLIVLLLGQQWVASLTIIKILSVVFIIRFIAGTMNFIVYLRQKQRLNFLFQTAFLSVVFFSFYGSHFFDLEETTTLIVYTISIGVYSLIHLKVTHGLSQIPKA